jgi:hypothetical protein
MTQYQKGDIIEFNTVLGHIHYYLLVSEQKPIEYERIHYEGVSLMTGSIHDLYLVDGDSAIKKVA